MTKPLDDFIHTWKADAKGIKPVFLQLYAYLQSLTDVTLAYKGRPGVSHSLRARHKGQRKRPLFVLVDIIDDAPSARWLSICFYADMVSDAEERGDVVPGGLSGEDARCFDVDGPGEGIEAFLLERLREAHEKAASE